MKTETVVVQQLDSTKSNNRVNGRAVRHIVRLASNQEVGSEEFPYVYNGVRHVVRLPTNQKGWDDSVENCAKSLVIAEALIAPLWDDDLHCQVYRWSGNPDDKLSLQCPNGYPSTLLGGFSDSNEQSIQT